MTQHETSKRLFERATKCIPGGVNSPVRAFRAVGGEPLFMSEAVGPYLVDADAERYVDYIGSWGPMILGHAHPDVVSAAQSAMARGSSYGAPTAGEVEMAERVIEYVPSIEMLRLTSSGTEAVMGALRVARGFTGRELIVKFEGCYHGGADYLLVKAGSGAATLGHPDSAGVPDSIAGTTLILPFNDKRAVEDTFAKHGERIAALIVEPVVGNMGCVPPEPGFLELLRRITQKFGSLLVFDEVMTGFRLARGGAQERYGIKPDLTALAKILGGGLPMGGYGGRRDIMNLVAPLGPVYQAGTLSGNPVAVAAGLTTLRLLGENGVYEKLEASSSKLESIITEAASAAKVKCAIQRVGSMITVFFQETPVKSWTDASRSDTKAFARFHRTLLEHGVYWPPSQYEAAFVSLAHDDEAFEITRNAVRAGFTAVASSIE